MTREEMLAAMEADAARPLPEPGTSEDRTSMMFWLPKLVAASLLVPKTKMVLASRDELHDVWRLFDGEAMTGAAQPFFDRLKRGADELGYPCFLRTSYTSGKHDWDNTCFLRDPKRIPRQVFKIIEYAEISSMFAPPHDWWAVREYLPVTPLAVCHGWSNMPVCREFRVFVNDGAVQCWHPYWPLNALEQGGALAPDVAYVQLIECKDEAGLLELASMAGAACGGHWSVDVMETARGWFITDMAEGQKSFHWKSCRHAPKE
jgi:hypothetical protein